MEKEQKVDFLRRKPELRENKNRFMQTSRRGFALMAEVKKVKEEVQKEKDYVIS